MSEEIILVGGRPPGAPTHKNWQKKASKIAKKDAAGYLELLKKYNGELLNASPVELAAAASKYGSPKEASIARQRAQHEYDEIFDERGAYRFDLRVNIRGRGHKKSTKGHRL